MAQFIKNGRYGSHQYAYLATPNLTAEHAFLIDRVLRRIEKSSLRTLDPLARAESNSQNLLHLGLANRQVSRQKPPFIAEVLNDNMGDIPYSRLRHIYSATFKRQRSQPFSDENAGHRKSAKNFREIISHLDEGTRFQ